MNNQQRGLRTAAERPRRITRFRCQAGLSLQLPSILFAVSLVLPGLPSAFAQTSDPTSCADSLFGSAGCQTSPQQGTNTAGPTNGQNTNGQAFQPQIQNQNGSNSNQLYVDSAGNQWQHVTPQTDRNQLQFFPPDPVTDFQKLARSSSGEMIPIFGRDMFQRAPSTFAPADEIPVTADYVIGPGDEVLVRLWGAEQTTSNSQLTVDTSGDIYVPRVGTVHVAGLRASELQDRISSEVNRVFRNYRISTSLGHLRSIQVYVVGEARRPGAYTISALSTVLNALFASGGPSVQGSMRHIQVRRGDRVITDFDLYDLVLRGDKTHDVRLETGDTIFIPHVGPQVALTGSVRHPAVYELKDAADGNAPTTLNDLLTLGGGLSSTAAPNKIRLERIDTSLRRTAVTVNLDANGRAMALHDGDVLYADHISPGYEQSVTIRGNLANPGRFAWTPGMRLSDIIPDRNSLLTNDYWRTRNKLGVPTPLFQPFDFNDTTDTRFGQANAENAANTQGTKMNSGVNGYSQQLGRNNSNANTQSEQDFTAQQAGLASGGVVSRNSTMLDEAASLESNGTTTLDSSGNSTTGQQSNNGTPNKNSNGVSTVNPNANGPQTPQPPPPELNRIRIPAPEIDWSYAVIERLDPNTLKSTLIPFNLGKLLQGGDTSQNLELQPNDVVTILNQRDILVPLAEQTKYVRLEGEFASAGVYSVGPNETLDKLVQRAGGFTSNAYLYGSSFLRESARQFQQQRLDEYITQLSADMERATAVRGASAPSGVSDPNALALERNIISQLRQLRATGRVVLEFAPESEGLASVPKLALENGDVFRVPSRPSIVSVIGAVYGQNIFLYNSKRHLEDYLALAGKTNRIADKDHAFIIRADGSVFSRERAKGVLSNHFDEARINPGDSIVVPEKLIKPTALRQLLDYSQILSSFGLAAAAINVVR